jgi:hypothetical protein
VTRWDKRGLLLAAPVPLPWASTHAALPAVTALEGNEAALYFSPRDTDGRAWIARARIRVDEPELSSLDPDPVLGPGPLGAFDDSGVTSSCLVEFAGRMYLYYTGWSLGRTVPFYLYAGLAVAEDGGAFAKVSSAPILERDGGDPFLTASPWVIVENGLWRMWYVSGTGWAEAENGPRQRYHIKYAESDDGVTWRRTGVVCIDYKDENEHAISRPCVVKDGDLYRMWFSARGDAYRIGYAESTDGLGWERADTRAGFEASAEGWDSEMQAYPTVFDACGQRIMLYNGNDYGATGIGYAIAEQ